MEVRDNGGHVGIPGDNYAIKRLCRVRAYSLLTDTFVCFSIHGVRAMWLIRIATIDIGSVSSFLRLLRSYRGEFHIQ